MTRVPLRENILSRRSAAWLALLAGGFIFMLAGQLFFDYRAAQKHAPLRSPAAAELRALILQHQAQPDKHEIKAAITELDREIRQHFLRHTRASRRGGGLLLIGLAVFLYAAHALLTKPTVIVPAAGRKSLSRFFARGLLAAAAGIILGYAAVSELANPAREAAAVFGEPPPTYEQRLAQWPAFRGADNSGVSRHTNLPASWDEASGQNIVWQVKTPLPGYNSPIIWNEAVIITGANLRQRAVYCHNLADGKLLWQTAMPPPPGAGGEIPIWEELGEGVVAAATAATDGRAVFVYFSNGQVAALNLKDGGIIWRRYLGPPEGNSFGNSSSLLLDATNLYVMHDAQEYRLLALDIATGSINWQVKRQASSWASPLLLPRAAGGAQIIIPGSPLVEAYSAADGQRLWWAELFSGDITPAPVAAADQVFVTFDGYGVYALDAGKRGALSKENRGILWHLADADLEFNFFPEVSSPLYHDGFLYFFAFDYLTCLNAATGKLVYQKQLDSDATYASPAAADGKLYLFANDRTFVARLGKEYAPLGEGKLAEAVQSSPAFAPGALLLRGKDTLYRIGNKQQEAGERDE